MKKIKLFLGFIILVFAGLIVYQNREYFMTVQPMSLSLGVETWHWTVPGLQNLAYYGIFLGIGLFVAGFYGLSSKIKSRKTIKSLNATIESHLEKISALKKDLEKFRNDPYNREQGEEQEETPEEEKVIVLEKKEIA